MHLKLPLLFAAPGDNAFDVARILIERGAKVTIVMRSARPRAQALLVNRIREYAAAYSRLSALNILLVIIVQCCASSVW